MKYNLSTLLKEENEYARFLENINHLRKEIENGTINGYTFKGSEKILKSNLNAYTEDIENLKPTLLKHEEKLQELLNAGNGKARERTLDIHNIIDHTNELIKKYDIPMKYLNDCTFYIYPFAEKVANAYKYKFMSTTFTIQVEKGKIWLIAIDREETNHNYKFEARLTKEAKEKILERYLTF